jgi:hypothetical protein
MVDFYGPDGEPADDRWAPDAAELARMLRPFVSPDDDGPLTAA